jgi:hypothetical protein
VKPKSQINHSDYDSSPNSQIKDLENILNRAEEKASPEGKVILSTGRLMIAEKKIVRGSCWDYINAVYNHALYPVGKRVNALKSKIIGPFADISIIRPGDWLYFINYSFSEVDHSGIFVEWTNIEKKYAVILSYQGRRNKSPATYKIYDLKNVYYIIRPKSNSLE